MIATDGHTTSLAQLESNAERSRAALVETVDVLQRRLSPEAIKEDVRGYVRDTGHGILRNLEHRARENPLQAAAVAAAVAYPLWRLVASIPVPILLIGTGLALTRRPAQNSATTRPNDNGFISRARDRVGEATDAVAQKLGEVAESVQQTVQSARQTLEHTSAEQLTGSFAEKLSRTTAAARTMTSDAASGAAEMVSSSYRSGAEAAARAGSQMTQTGQRAQHAAVDTIERHPMMVGAIGLAIGAVLAAALPATRQENRLMGDARGQLKNKAREIASEGAQAVKSAAGQVYEETVQHARDQGLSSEGLRESLKEAGVKVKAVVERVTGDDSAKSDQASPKTASNASY